MGITKQKIMTHVEKVKAALTAKGIKFEEQQFSLGIYLGRHVWHWFTKGGGVKQDWLYFDHSYSQNTGRTKKGTMHALRVQMAIEKKIGLDFTDLVEKELAPFKLVESPSRPHTPGLTESYLKGFPQADEDQELEAARQEARIEDAWDNYRRGGQD